MEVMKRVAVRGEGEANAQLPSSSSDDHSLFTLAMEAGNIVTPVDLARDIGIRVDLVTPSPLLCSGKLISSSLPFPSVRLFLTEQSTNGNTGRPINPTASNLPGSEKLLFRSMTCFTNLSPSPRQVCASIRG
jgi:hypothetical protein